MALSGARRTILEAIRSEGQPLSAAAVAQKIGKGRTAVTNLIGKLVQSGHLIEPVHHKYALPGDTDDRSDSGDTRDTRDTDTLSLSADGQSDTQKVPISRENVESVTGVTGVTTETPPKGDTEIIAYCRNPFECETQRRHVLVDGEYECTHCGMLRIERVAA